MHLLSITMRWKKNMGFGQEIWMFFYLLGLWGRLLRVDQLTGGVVSVGLLLAAILVKKGFSDGKLLIGIITLVVIHILFLPQLLSAFKVRLAADRPGKIVF
jgi:hypothetical protein